MLNRPDVLSMGYGKDVLLQLQNVVISIPSDVYRNIFHTCSPLSASSTVIFSSELCFFRTAYRKVYSKYAVFKPLVSFRNVYYLSVYLQFPIFRTSHRYHLAMQMKINSTIRMYGFRCFTWYCIPAAHCCRTMYKYWSKLTSTFVTTRQIVQYQHSLTECHGYIRRSLNHWQSKLLAFGWNFLHFCQTSEVLRKLTRKKASTANCKVRSTLSSNRSKSQVFPFYRDK